MNIINMEKRLLSQPLTPELMWDAKRLGFSDIQIGTLADRIPEQVREMRHEWNIRPVYKMVDTCAAEFDAETPYFYSTYETENEAEPLEGKKPSLSAAGRSASARESNLIIAVCTVWALEEVRL